MVEMTLLEIQVKLELGKILNECACHINKMEKPFKDYINLDSIRLSQFFRNVYEKFIKDIPKLEITELIKATNLKELTIYIQSKQTD